jgi:hypothetical protein
MLATLLLGIGTDDGSNRRVTDVNMGSSGCPWNRTPEGDEGNPRLTEVREQRSPLVAVRMERHVHCISMIEPEPVMGWRLAKGGNGQIAPKGVQKKFLDLWRIRQRP